MTNEPTDTSKPEQASEPLALRQNGLLGRAPWADDVESWLEVSNAQEIADDIDRYALQVAARAQAAERERWRSAAAAVFAADDEYGCGFYNYGGWCEAYAALRKMTEA